MLAAGHSLCLSSFCPDILALGHHPFQTPMPHCLHISLLSIVVAAACILSSTQLCTPCEACTTVAAAFLWRHSCYLCCSYIFPSLPPASWLPCAEQLKSSLLTSPFLYTSHHFRRTLSVENGLFLVSSETFCISVDTL